MSDDVEREYVANSRKAWGRGTFEDEALRNLVENWNGDFQDVEEIQLTRVEGFSEIRYDGVYADEILNDEALEIPGGSLDEIKEHLMEAEILAEGAIVEASE